ncbi:MAG: gliding motility protein GldC [Saprospiraceae bacterium]|nr:gliding motility protein GldC [Saprospiraceae bacterium]
MKKSKINVEVTLDDHKVPEEITWSAPDQNQLNESAKAMLLSFFDRNSRETLKIDLWTKDMQVVEMDRFFYQTLRSMVDTYFRATSNQKLAREMQQFVQYFGEQTEIIRKEKE